LAVRDFLGLMPELWPPAWIARSPMPLVHPEEPVSPDLVRI